MPENQIRVTFQPQGRAVFVLEGSSVLEAAARAQLAIETPCGGQGTCGKCRVRLSGRLCSPTPTERKLLSEEQLADGWRLACQASICGECTIEVPESSIFAAQRRILTEAQTAAGEVRPV
ncbi:MAG: 2Fe-2S iron-sulfur cluster binding domain-containing protein, partial [Planctomycetes bacterium]|nr:2Fe-2S iron-sulfur cluster binding domain-containing protein [Planctomycetota bacterium]